ncbi:hypothetical protein BC938DRAFT_474299 [Jimgerdemannia flammicorona]|uniref:Uncharacterized protein n=1 Tax=Jimgerdemannia flammicorona TaxID=994334 RepID=A0A433QSM5_9FUNG|nr:hypothetical protein BC938DRAFT_474299 [Jimgerdemannia flammicorona]
MSFVENPLPTLYDFLGKFGLDKHYNAFREAGASEDAIQKMLTWPQSVLEQYLDMTNILRPFEEAEFKASLKRMQQQAVVTVPTYFGEILRRAASGDMDRLPRVPTLGGHLRGISGARDFGASTERHVNQVIGELFAANVVSSFNPVVMLTDLDRNHMFLWLGRPTPQVKSASTNSKQSPQSPIAGRSIAIHGTKLDTLHKAASFARALIAPKQLTTCDIQAPAFDPDDDDYIASFDEFVEDVVTVESTAHEEAPFCASGLPELLLYNGLDAVNAIE